MPANLVFRRKIWGARDNGIPPRSTPAFNLLITLLKVIISDLSKSYSSECETVLHLIDSVRGDDASLTRSAHWMDGFSPTNRF